MLEFQDDTENMMGKLRACAYKIGLCFIRFHVLKGVFSVTLLNLPNPVINFCR